MAESKCRIYFCMFMNYLLFISSRGQEVEGRPDKRAAYSTLGYGGTTSTQSTGTIVSPGYPGDYPNDYNFRYDIYIGQEKADLEIYFKYFDLESCPNCGCDYVMIENYNLTNPMKFCGAVLPNGGGQVFLDNVDDYVWITFHSNSNQRRSGFYANYELTRRSGNTSYLAGGSVCPPLMCPYCSIGQSPEYDFTGVCPYCFCKADSKKTTENSFHTAFSSTCPPVVCPQCPYGFFSHYDYSSTCTQCYCLHSHQSTYRPWNTESTTYFPWRPQSTTLHQQSTSFHPWWISTSHRPRTTTAYHPWATTAYRPRTTTAYHPRTTTAYRPRTTTAYHPWRTTAYRPRATTVYHPWTITAYRPRTTTAYHPWTTTAYRPRTTTVYHPWRTTAYRPRATTSYHPWRTTRNYPWLTTATPQHYYPDTRCPPIYCTTCRAGYYEHYRYNSEGCMVCECRWGRQTVSSPHEYATTPPNWPYRTSYRQYGTTESQGTGYFYGQTGVISSPNFPYSGYDNNSDRRYYIYLGGPSGTLKTIALTFDEFNIERCGQDCSCDYLVIDSLETNGTKMCDSNRINHRRTYYVHTYDYALSLEFKSDGSVSMPGFSLRYQVVDSNTTYIDCQTTSCSSHCNTSANVIDYFGCCHCYDNYSTSPVPTSAGLPYSTSAYDRTTRVDCIDYFTPGSTIKFPTAGYMYQNNYECEFRLDIGSDWFQYDRQAMLTVEYLDMEECGRIDCNCDYLQFLNTNLRGKLCGTKRVPRTYYITPSSPYERYIRLKVKTDGSVAHTGFQLRYRTLDNSHEYACNTDGCSIYCPDGYEMNGLGCPECSCNSSVESSVVPFQFTTLTTAPTNWTGSATLSKSKLLQMLQQLATDAHRLGEYASSLELEANAIRKDVAASLINNFAKRSESIYVAEEDTNTSQ